MDNQPTDNVTRWVMREEALLDDIARQQRILDGVAERITPYLCRSGNSEVGDLARGIRDLIEPVAKSRVGGGVGAVFGGGHVPEDRRGYLT